MTVAQQSTFHREATPVAPPLDLWVDVPAGTYRIGEGHEARAALLPAFKIGRYPVTAAHFAVFLAATGCAEHPVIGHDGPTGVHPATDVTFAEAEAFCHWASERLGIPVRLPAGEEWEAAARGPEGRDWPWGDTFDPNRCACVEAGWGWTVPVDVHPTGAGPFGAEQMAGNVWEWTTDLCEDGAWRVVRGGSHLDYAWGVRAARTLGADPARATRTTGFRIAMTV